MANGVLGALALLLAVAYGFGISNIPKLNLGDPIGPRAFPLIILAILIIAGVLLILESVKARSWRRDAGDLAVFLRGDVKVVAATAAWLALYYIAFERVGYLLSTAVFLAVLMSYLHLGRRWVAIATAIAFSVVSYFLFAHVFEVPLPAGILPI